MDRKATMFPPERNSQHRLEFFEVPLAVGGSTIPIALPGWKRSNIVIQKTLDSKIQDLCAKLFLVVAHLMLINGPARSGKFAVLRTCLPALPSPLKGVMAPPAPALAASTGELNHNPQ